MPKTTRTYEEIESFKNRILDTALKLIVEEGFKNLSMRRIAARLDITATTIYNYYTNKDELMLMIYIQGFEVLFDMLGRKYDEFEAPVPKIDAMIRVYVEFALKYPSYYDIMFNMHTPKYTDYIGTDMESLALKEKQIALKCLELFIDAVRGIFQPDKSLSEDFIRYKTIQFWSDLHGIISLYNSGVLYEVDEQSDLILESRVNDLINSFMQIKNAYEAGELSA
jgi:AcrR family transcriptional regulator